MTLSYDLFWSFRSPYSYLLTKRLVALEQEFDVICNVRIVYPIAVRTPEFFDKNDPLWLQYLIRDAFRSAEFLGLPLKWPTPDPVVMDYATRTYPKEQPYIYRLSQLGQLAAEQGRGLAFLDEVSSLIWGGTVTGWNEGDHLAQAAARAGLDLAAMDAIVLSDSERLNDAITANQIAQREGGHYGVPLMVFNGEPFFGQDRLDQMVWRMKGKGLEHRSN